MRLPALPVLLAVAQCSATRLFVASYRGNITSLSLTAGETPESYSLEVSASSSACAPGNASWITLDKSRDLIFCTERGLKTPNGTLNTLKIQEDGSLENLSRIPTPYGGVASVLYANNSGLAVAYYTSSSVASYNISNTEDVETLQSVTYGAEVNHTAPHPHDAILDPTGEFVIVPDLGSDLLRLYHINQNTLELETLDPFTTPFGSGPRHAEFLVTGSKTYLYVVFELGNLLIGYDVVYNNGSIGLTQIYETSMLKTLNGTDLQRYSAAAEIHVSPDTNFIIVSQRNDTSFSIPNPSDPSSTTTIESDSLFTYSVDHSSGELALVEQSPAGGNTPRQFSINKAGDLLAVGLQNDGRVVIISRDVTTGLLGDIVAAVDVAGQVVCVIWDE